MLYVSRIVCKDDSELYGVYDTEDDTEQIVTWNDLDKIITKLNIHVGGTIIDPESVEVGHPFMSYAFPYQDEKYLIRDQIKAKTLIGVDITRWKDEVTAIEVDGKIIRGDMTIRLSDFGHKMSCVARLYVHPEAEGRGSLTVVLDRSVNIYGEVYSMLMSGIRWDISEIIDLEFIRKLHTFGWYHYGEKCLKDYIIDRRGRIKDGRLCCM